MEPGSRCICVTAAWPTGANCQLGIKPEARKSYLDRKSMHHDGFLGCFYGFGLFFLHTLRVQLGLPTTKPEDLEPTVQEVVPCRSQPHLAQSTSDTSHAHVPSFVSSGGGSWAYVRASVRPTCISNLSLLPKALSRCECKCDLLRAVNLKSEACV